MSRIRKFYERRLRALLKSDDAQQVSALFTAAAQAAQAGNIHPSLALALVHAGLRRQRENTAAFPRQFVCDAGVGGLARWLRGGGYAAYWNPNLDDAAVIREARRRGATLITTDSLMMERGVLRDGIVPAVFVPSSLTCEDQLMIVLAELGLALRESRCMTCGGELRRVEKSEVADRIPPKTALWLDEYFVCSACGQLFWRGTHWQKITEKLRLLNSASLIASGKR